MSKQTSAKVDLSELVTLWLDGFGSGVATLAMKQLHCTAADADRIAGDIVNQIVSDDAVTQAITDEVRTTIIDKDRSNPNRTMPVNNPRRMN